MPVAPLPLAEGETLLWQARPGVIALARQYLWPGLVGICALGFLVFILVLVEADGNRLTGIGTGLMGLLLLAAFVAAHLPVIAATLAPRILYGLSDRAAWLWLRVPFGRPRRLALKAMRAVTVTLGRDGSATVAFDLRRAEGGARWYQMPGIREGEAVITVLQGLDVPLMVERPFDPVPDEDLEGEDDEPARPSAADPAE